MDGRSQFTVRRERDAIVVFVDVLQHELTLRVIAIQLSNGRFQCPVDVIARCDIDLQKEIRRHNINDDRRELTVNRRISG